jgi:hypothetical protein
MEVRQQHGKHVADAAELLAVLATSESTSASTPGSLDWPRLMLTSPSWPPVMNAVNGLIDCTTSPDNGSLNTGMRGSSILSAPRLAHCSGA